MTAETFCTCPVEGEFIVHWYGCGDPGWTAEDAATTTEVVA